MAKNEELIMQAKCWQWHYNNFPGERGWLRRTKNELDNHPPKNKWDTIKQLGENKATGIVKGTWDLFYMIEPIVWFEAKIHPNILTPEQEIFRNRGIECGYMFFTFYTIEEFKNLIYGFH